MISQERASERIVEKIGEVVRNRTQERVLNRTVEETSEVVHSIPMDVEHALMERKRGTGPYAGRPWVARSTTKGRSDTP